MGVQAVPGLDVGVVVVLLLDDLLRRFEDVVVGRAVFPLLFGVSYELLALHLLLRVALLMLARQTFLLVKGSIPLSW